MAETKPRKTAAASGKTPAQSAKGASTTAAKRAAKAAPLKTGAAAAAAAAAVPAGEAKSRFNAALEEAKAGAAALRAEAESRADGLREQAATRSDDLVSDARAYGDKALHKAGELAVEGKAVASDVIASLGKVVADTAPQIDAKLGEQYGDYARRASRSLTEASAKLETKSLDELGSDAREFVRKSPGTAVGIAAVLGFLVARLFRGTRD
jgi:ElaB/YqjD/DUF883 family membrane-anchored ribosome-binding protein